jgi:hypothetical protein
MTNHVSSNLSTDAVEDGTQFREFPQPASHTVIRLFSRPLLHECGAGQARNERRRESSPHACVRGWRGAMRVRI